MAPPIPKLAVLLTYPDTSARMAKPPQSGTILEMIARIFFSCSMDSEDSIAVWAVGIVPEHLHVVRDLCVALLLAGACAVPERLLLLGHRPSHDDLPGLHVDDDVVGMGQRSGSILDTEPLAAIEFPLP